MIYLLVYLTINCFITLRVTQKLLEDFYFDTTLDAVIYYIVNILFALPLWIYFKFERFWRKQDDKSEI